MRRQKICILGGTGFVGSRLTSLLCSKGYTVRVLTRRREQHRQLLVLPRLELITADIYDPQVLKKYFSDIDVVINLVGILNEKRDNGQGFHKTHVELAENIMTSCELLGVARVLHMSALNANIKKTSSFYLQSKGEAEVLVHSSKNIDVTSFRPSVIFGVEDSFFNRFAAVLKISPLIFPLACGQTRFSPIFVGDVATVFMKSINNPATFGSHYDLCGPKTYTLEQLVRYTAQCRGLFRIIFSLSDRLSRWQASVLEYVPGKPFSRDNYRSLQQNSVCDCEFPTVFQFIPESIETIVPQYIK